MHPVGVVLLILWLRAINVKIWQRVIPKRPAENNDGAKHGFVTRGERLCILYISATGSHDFPCKRA